MTDPIDEFMLHNIDIEQCLEELECDDEECPDESQEETSAEVQGASSAET